ncbi:7tm Odorant receptor [Nesidiocoris tenuis]|uniref:Odorant receptor n=1 Tax=Nesidiocoris tenuis TaxID=355587 RepID=A0ABN7AAN2_9HEMI|nr:7tm Odorant receptor [Nesidiocoris tenuis]
MTAVGYDDMLGYKFLGLHKFVIHWAGVRTDISSGNDPIRVKMARCLGIFFALITGFQASAATLAAYDRMMEKDYEVVSIVIAFVSLAVSALSKYQILITKSDSMHRLGVWLINVKKARGDAKLLGIESLAIRVGRSLYFTVLLTSFVWAVGPAVNNFTPFYPSRVPHLDDELVATIAYPYVQVPTYLFLSTIIVYCVSSVVHVMGVFCAEVRRLGNRWSDVVYDEKNPEQFMTVMKECVNRHEKLLDVMDDLCTVFDPMFGFQILFFIAHFCAFNFCLLKTTGFEAIAPLMPLIFMSMLEFGFLCYVGEEITDAFEQFYRAIYNTNWYESRVSDKKSMVFVLEFFKKRRNLTGATVVTASLSSFVEALRQAFSLYTLMEALTANE